MAPSATLLGFVLLTGSSAMAILRSRPGDTAATAAFVAASYAALLLLFYSLRRFETAPPGSAGIRRRARIGVWLTTTLLTAMFSWRVAAVVPWPVADGVWLIGGSTAIGGFYVLFLLPTGD
ncbi:hypothetical protein C2845_PM09G03180 [Panicum miliaceum]|uniref:Uncharacterized protein n=1 Tax=Panicum miliaceum TaxID=4540 RepID=A0A3L6S139_PANMI|nr:hypothetical protein C2845_PM09G03180 [Panicum miliaceum]